MEIGLFLLEVCVVETNVFLLEVPGFKSQFWLIPCLISDRFFLCQHLLPFGMRWFIFASSNLCFMFQRVMFVFVLLVVSNVFSTFHWYNVISSEIVFYCSICLAVMTYLWLVHWLVTCRNRHHCSEKLGSMLNLILSFEDAKFAMRNSSNVWTNASVGCHQVYRINNS